MFNSGVKFVLSYTEGLDQRTEAKCTEKMYLQHSIIRASGGKTWTEQMYGENVPAMGDCLN